MASREPCSASAKLNRLYRVIEDCYLGERLMVILPESHAALLRMRE